MRRTSPGGTSVEIELTISQRIQEYQEKLAELQRLQEEVVSAEGTIYQELGQRRVDVLKADVNRMRADLLADLAARTAQMKTALKETLTPQQLLDHGDMPDPPRSRWMQWHRWREWTRLDWADALVVGGLLGVGGLLLVGLFTRTACVLGAVLLLMFYLPTMPLPGIPESLRGEGYPFVNKNLIEMLALLTLATTRSGRWVGLDGLVQFLNPRRWRKRSDEPRGNQASENERAVVTAPIPYQRETRHGT